MKEIQKATPVDWNKLCKECEREIVPEVVQCFPTRTRLLVKIISYIQKVYGGKEFSLETWQFANLIAVITGKKCTIRREGMLKRRKWGCKWHYRYKVEWGEESNRHLDCIAGRPYKCYPL